MLLKYGKGLLSFLRKNIEQNIFSNKQVILFRLLRAKIHDADASKDVRCIFKVVFFQIS